MPPLSQLRKGNIGGSPKGIEKYLQKLRHAGLINPDDQEKKEYPAVAYDDMSGEYFDTAKIAWVTEQRNKLLEKWYGPTGLMAEIPSTSGGGTTRVDPTRVNVKRMIGNNEAAYEAKEISYEEYAKNFRIYDSIEKFRERWDSLPARAEEKEYFTSPITDSEGSVTGETKHWNPRKKLKRRNLGREEGGGMPGTFITTEEEELSLLGARFHIEDLNILASEYPEGTPAHTNKMREELKKHIFENWVPITADDFDPKISSEEVIERSEQNSTFGWRRKTDDEREASAIGEKELGKLNREDKEMAKKGKDERDASTHAEIDQFIQKQTVPGKEDWWSPLNWMGFPPEGDVTQRTIGGHEHHAAQLGEFGGGAEWYDLPPTGEEAGLVHHPAQEIPSDPEALRTDYEKIFAGPSSEGKRKYAEKMAKIMDARPPGLPSELTNIYDPFSAVAAMHDIVPPPEPLNLPKPKRPVETVAPPSKKARRRHPLAPINPSISPSYKPYPRLKPLLESKIREKIDSVILNEVDKQLPKEKLLNEWGKDWWDPFGFSQEGEGPKIINPKYGADRVPRNVPFAGDRTVPGMEPVYRFTKHGTEELDAPEQPAFVQGHDPRMPLGKTLVGDAAREAEWLTPEEQKAERMGKYSENPEAWLINPSPGRAPTPDELRLADNPYPPHSWAHGLKDFENLPEHEQNLVLANLLYTGVTLGSGLARPRAGLSKFEHPSGIVTKTPIPVSPQGRPPPREWARVSGKTAPPPGSPPRIRGETYTPAERAWLADGEYLPPVAAEPLPPLEPQTPVRLTPSEAIDSRLVMSRQGLRGAQYREHGRRLPGSRPKGALRSEPTGIDASPFGKSSTRVLDDARHKLPEGMRKDPAFKAEYREIRSNLKNAEPFNPHDPKSVNYADEMEKFVENWARDHNFDLSGWHKELARRAHRSAFPGSRSKFEVVPAGTASPPSLPPPPARPPMGFQPGGRPKAPARPSRPSPRDQRGARRAIRRRGERARGGPIREGIESDINRILMEELRILNEAAPTVATENPQQNIPAMIDQVIKGGVDSYNEAISMANIEGAAEVVSAVLQQVVELMMQEEMPPQPEEAVEAASKIFWDEQQRTPGV